jgi:hypothetical protein
MLKIVVDILDSDRVKQITYILHTYSDSLDVLNLKGEE